MSEEFDPYHKWLGIPPKDQPPNHYRLLGLELFESDPDVIEAAAFRQTAHVRTYQLGPHSALSQQLLNEIAAAKVCLLDPTERTAYDAELRKRVDAGAAAEAPAGGGPSLVPPPGAPEWTAAPPVVLPSSVLSAAGRKQAKPTHRPKPPWPVYAAVGAGALLVALLLAMLVPGPGSDAEVRGRKQTQAEKQTADVADAGSTVTAGPAAATAPPAAAQPPAEQPPPEGDASLRQDKPSPPEPLSTTPTPPADAAPKPETPGGDSKPGESPSTSVAPLPPLPADAEDQLKNGLAEARSPQDVRKLTEKALHYVDQAIAANDAETAKKLAACAVAAARQADDDGLSKAAALRYLEVQGPLSEEVIDGARKRLETWKRANGSNASPDSAAAWFSDAQVSPGSSAGGLSANDNTGAMRVQPADPGGASRTPSGAPQAVEKKPVILNTKTELFARHPNYARHDGLTFDVGIGNEYWGVGIAAVGYEFENVLSLRVELKINGKLKAYDHNAFLGFMVDYHTPLGYRKRVALSMGMYFKDRHGVPGKWGTAARPNEFVDFTKRPTNVIDLREWAPADWDGRTWFSVLNEHGGKNTSMTGRLVILEVR